MATWVIIAIGAVLLTAFLVGVGSYIVESSAVWRELLEACGSANIREVSVEDDINVLGELRIDDVEFVGHVFVLGEGLVFRLQRLNSHELLLFEWTAIRGFTIVAGESKRASFRLSTGEYRSVEVTIPWSSELEQERLLAASHQPKRLVPQRKLECRSLFWFGLGTFCHRAVASSRS